MDQKVLDELKDLLLKEKAAMEQSLSRIATPVDKEEGDYETKFEDIGADRDDNATEVDQFSSDSAVEATLEDRLQEIIEALERMEKGIYGICENCNKEIPVERLRANPAAKTCIKC